MMRGGSPGRPDGAMPGKLLRAEAGEVLHVRVDNQFSVPTTVHWHGLALRNDMDGVPNLTQLSIPAGTAVDYEFALRAPTGTTHTWGCSAIAGSTVH